MLISWYEFMRLCSATCALSFAHFTACCCACRGQEYQTEVVLLSRSILLQGGPQAESLLAGGHVRIQGQVCDLFGFEVIYTSTVHSDASNDASNECSVCCDGDGRLTVVRVQGQVW